MIRVVLPRHLRDLAGLHGEIHLPLDGEVTQRAVLDALEGAFPALRGTMRDPATDRRRPFIRFFAGEEDLSHDGPDDPLPAEVASGAQVFYVIGAIAGG